MSERPDPDTTPETFADLPLQPTGSGVADLEIAYEQMKLAEEAEADVGAGATPPAAAMPDADAEVETIAHPS